MLVLKYLSTQRSIRFTVDHTIALQTQHGPEETAAIIIIYPRLRHDIRNYIISCVTYQNMDAQSIPTIGHIST